MSPTLTSTSCDLDLWPFDPHNCSLFCNHFCQYCVDKFANGQTSRVDTVMSPGSLTWQMRNNVWYQLQHRQLTKRTTKKSREIAWRIQENDLMTENLLHEAIWCLLKVCDGKMVWWSYAWSYGGCFLQINKCFCNTSCTDVVDFIFLLQLLLCTAEAMLFHAQYNLLKVSNVTYCYCCKHDTDCFCWTTYSDWHFKKFNFFVFTKK